jgi:hypothetical protein
MTNSKLTHCNLQNFILGTSYAPTNYQGGGVCIYIKPDIKFTAIDLTQYCDDKNLEICSLKIKVAKQNIIVICICHLMVILNIS